MGGAGRGVTRISTPSGSITSPRVRTLSLGRDEAVRGPAA